MTTRRRIPAVILVSVCLLAACASSDEAAVTADAPPTTEAPLTTDTGDPVTTETSPGVEAAPTTDVTTTDAVPATTQPPQPAAPRQVEHQYGTTEVPTDPQRIVALSEEFLLADLLALGVTPVASSSNALEGFGGIDPLLTDGIEITTSATFNLEQLAGFAPDLILAYPVYIELVGYDILNEIAPTVAIGDDESDWRERLKLTAAVLGIDEIGAERIDEYEAAYTAAAEVLGGVQVSALSVFDPSFIRAYVDGGTFLVDAMIESGIDMVPGPAEVEGLDRVGRVQLSLEQFGLLQGDVIVMLQRIGLEDDAAREIAESVLWETLPAVQNNAVITLDRLGYPGAAGAAGFVTELAAAVAGLN